MSDYKLLLALHACELLTYNTSLFLFSGDQGKKMEHGLNAEISIRRIWCCSALVVEALLTFAEYRKFSLVLRNDLSARPGLRSLNAVCWISHLPLEVSLFKNARQKRLIRFDCTFWWVVLTILRYTLTCKYYVDTYIFHLIKSNEFCINPLSIVGAYVRLLLLFLFRVHRIFFYCAVSHRKS